MQLHTKLSEVLAHALWLCMPCRDKAMLKQQIDGLNGLHRLVILSVVAAGQEHVLSQSPTTDGKYLSHHVISPVCTAWSGHAWTGHA